MYDYKSLSKNDTIIMELIWKQGEVNNASILKELEGKPNWTRYTVKTYVKRLREKGLVGVRAASPRKQRYYPLITKEEFLANETSCYLNNHFEDITHMIAGLVNNEKITYDELDNLEQYIKALKSKKQGK